jgi:hypothetical protein
MSPFSRSYPEVYGPSSRVFLPSHQFAGAMYCDRGDALLGSSFSLRDRPGSVLEPAGCAFDQSPIPGRTEPSGQTPMGLRPLCFPGLMVERPLFASSFKSPDRDIESSHGAKLGVQPLQFAPDLLPLRVGNHRREKRDGRAQASERHAHLMQRFGIASALGA